MIDIGKKILWVKTPKCASESLFSAVKRQLGTRKPVVNRCIHTLKNNVEFGVLKGGNFGRFKQKNNNFYNSSYKFAIVRNPYDRVVSSYFYSLEKDWFSGSFREFIIGCPDGNPSSWARWAPESTFIDFLPLMKGHTRPLTMTLHKQKEGIDYLDEVVKFENLTADINNLFKKFDLPSIKIPHKNRTRHKHYTEYYDEELRGIVAEKFAQDIEVFGYEFETSFYNAKKFIENKRGRGLQSLCGKGSWLKNTSKTRPFIDEILKKYNISSVLDLGCGDWNWFKSINLLDCDYLGWDADEKMIAHNNEKFGSDKVSFEVKDIVNEKYPEVDLIICRDVLFHLNHECVFKILNEAKNKSKYFISTSFDQRVNITPKFKLWGFFPLNLNISPFNLETYEIDSCHEEGAQRGHKYINLYKFEGQTGAT